MEYENFEITQKDNAKKLIDSGNPELMIQGIIGSINGINDAKWLQSICLNLVYHPNFWVAKTAISGLGDIARIHNWLERDKVFDKLSKIKEPKLMGVIEVLEDDLNIYFK